MLFEALKLGLSSNHLQLQRCSFKRHQKCHRTRPRDFNKDIKATQTTQVGQSLSNNEPSGLELYWSMRKAKWAWKEKKKEERKKNE